MKTAQQSGVRSGNHSGRKSRNGKVYSTKHNDRQFNVSNAEHINQEDVSANRYWTFAGLMERGDKSLKVIPKTLKHDNKKIFSFAEYERAIYYVLFSEQLAMINANYFRQRHQEKVQSMEEFITKDKHCAEEDIITFGTRNNHIDIDTFEKIFMKYVEWHNEKFGDYIILLDAALHLDEPDAAPHIHLRKVWAADYIPYAERCNAEAKQHNKIAEQHNAEVQKSGHGKKMKLKKLKEIPEDDYKIVNQTEALLQLGVTRPEPDKPEGRRNNAKMTYTKLCREALIEIAKQFGVEIIEEPREKSENGLSLLAYKVRETKAELRQLEEELEARKSELKSADDEVSSLKSQKVDLENQNEIFKNQYNELQQQNEMLESEIIDKQDEILQMIYELEKIKLEEPVAPKKKFAESDEKFKARQADYEKRRKEYLLQVENFPAVQSIRKRIKELEKRKCLIDAEVEERVQRVYNREMLMLCKELKTIHLPDSETNIWDYYLEATNEKNLMDVQQRMYDKTKEQQQEQSSAEPEHKQQKSKTGYELEL